MLWLLQPNPLYKKTPPTEHNIRSNHPRKPPRPGSLEARRPHPAAAKPKTKESDPEHSEKRRKLVEKTGKIKSKVSQGIREKTTGKTQKKYTPQHLGGFLMLEECFVGFVRFRRLYLASIKHPFASPGECFISLKNLRFQKQATLRYTMIYPIPK